MGRPTTSMKKGWLCWTSCDEKNHEIAPVMIQIEWWSKSSDDSQWWYRFSDDPDPVMMPMMIKIKRWSRSNDDVPWWSRSRDDPNPVMMSHDDPDREMIQIQRMKMTWRWRWLEDEYDLKMKMTWRWRWLEESEDLRFRWRDDQVDTEKKTSVENCVERIPS